MHEFGSAVLPDRARASYGPVPVPAPRPEQAIAFPVVERVVRLLDAVALAGALVGAALAAGTRLPAGQIAICVAVVPYLTLIALQAQAAYRADNLRVWAQMRAVLIAIGLATAGLAVTLALMRGGLADQRRFVLQAGASGAATLLAGRVVLLILLAFWRATGRLTRNVAIIGANDYSRSFIETIRADPSSGMTIVGLYDDRLARTPQVHAKVMVQGTVESLIADARTQRIDVIVVALPLAASARIADIRAQLSPTVADIFLTADTAGLQYSGRDFAALGRNGVIRIGSRPLSDWDAALKAGFDRVASLLLLIGLSPLLLGVAALVRLDSPGPALFRQPRIGFNNRAFTVFKFRTMYREMTDHLADRQTTRNDARVTKLGRFLRRSSIDELPQLLNVLQGDMSLVGPRPHAPNTKAENRLFDEVVADYALRHRIKPGITGWAQVNGWRGETPRVEDIEQRVAHDLSYIENWSMLLDLKILLLTAFKGFRGKNAY